MLSEGFLNMAGTPLIAGLVILGLFLYLSFRFRLPWSFTLPTTGAFVIILSMKYLESWMSWFILLIGFIMAGYGFYRWNKGRG